MNTIKLKLTPQSKDLGAELFDSLMELSYNGIEVTPKNYEEFPMPWDAAASIENGMLILRGDLGQQGSHRGYAETGIPLDRVDNYLTLSITPNDEESAAQLDAIFTEYGWL